MSGREGSLWIENEQLCYIDEDGDKRCGNLSDIDVEVRDSGTFVLSSNTFDFGANLGAVSGSNNVAVVDGTIEIQDDGTKTLDADSISFDDNLTATSSNNVAKVSGAAGGGTTSGGTITVEDNEVNASATDTISFDSNLSVVHSGGKSLIDGSGGSIVIQDSGASGSAADTISFDSNLDVTHSGGSSIVDSTASGGGSIDKREFQNSPIPTTVLRPGQFISFRTHVPYGVDLNLWAMGVQNASNSVPSGLTAEVDDETRNQNLASENAKRVTGSSTIGSATGEANIAFRIENDTGNTQNASATFSYTLEGEREVETLIYGGDDSSDHYFWEVTLDGSLLDRTQLSSPTMGCDVTTDGNIMLGVHTGSSSETLFNQYSTDLSLNWSYGIGDSTNNRPETVAVDSNGDAYGGLRMNDDTGEIHAINSDGTKKWSKSISVPVTEIVVDESGSTTYVYAATAFDGDVIKYDTDGNQIWRNALHSNDNIYGFSVGPDGDLLTGTDGPNVARWSSDGSNQWSISHSAFVWSTEIDSSGNAYFGDGNGGLFKYSSDGSTEEWSNTDALGQIFDIYFFDGTIYTSTEHGYVRSVTTGGSTNWEVQPANKIWEIGIPGAQY